MSDSVSILIPNYNGFEMLQLCIESVRRFTTDYPYQIIVYDDESHYKHDGIDTPNEMDLEYLAACESKGWLRVVRGEKQLGHGGALNRLVNDICDTDYAVLMDNDIQIRFAGWLPEFIRIAKSDPKTLVVCEPRAKGYWPRGFRPGMFMFWFGLIDMRLYRDGMQVDWAWHHTSRLEEPWLSEFAELYPPEQNEFFQMYSRDGSYRDFDRDMVCFDPGAILYNQLKFWNPKGYIFKDLSPKLHAAHKHYGHCSSFLDPNNATGEYPLPERYRERIGVIRSELARLRGQG